MKRSTTKGGIFSLLIIAFFSLPLFASNPPFEIIRPLVKSVTDEAYASVVVRVNDPSLTRIGVRDANGTESFEAFVPKRNVYCRSVRLSLGENRIEVNVYRGEEKLSSQVIPVYYRSEIFSEFQEEPSGYRKNIFHADKTELLCKTCHKMNDTVQ